jgi:hypothetical protein
MTYRCQPRVRGGFDVRKRDPGNHAAPSDHLTARPVVITLDAVQLARPPAGTPERLADLPQILEHVREHRVVVDVGGGHHHGQRQPGAVTNRMALGAGLAPAYAAAPDRVPLFGCPHKHRVRARPRPVDLPGKYQVSRRTLRAALQSAWPQPRKPMPPRSSS